MAGRSGSTQPAGAGEPPERKTGAALAQLKARDYADKYRAPGRAVHLIGVEIGAESRAIVVFETEPA